MQVAAAETLKQGLSFRSLFQALLHEHAIAIFALSMELLTFLIPMENWLFRLETRMK